MVQSAETHEIALDSEESNFFCPDSPFSGQKVLAVGGFPCITSSTCPVCNTWP